MPIGKLNKFERGVLNKCEHLFSQLDAAAGQPDRDNQPEKDEDLEQDGGRWSAKVVGGGGNADGGLRGG